MKGQRQIQIAQRSKNTIGSQAPTLQPDDYEAQDQDEDEDNSDTMAFVQEIMDAAKRSSGSEGGPEHFLERIADYLFGEMPNGSAVSIHESRPA